MPVDRHARASSARSAARRAAPGGRRRRRAHRLGAARRLPRPAPPARSSRRDDARCRRARPPRPRRHRRWPRARTARSPLGAAAPAVVGDARPDPRASARARCARSGIPEDAQVGISGLERIFDERLAGTPGGELRAGDRAAGRSASRAGAGRAHDDRPDGPAGRGRRRSAGRLGGVVALRPRTGEILGVRRASPSPACSRPARRSRSSRWPARWRAASSSRRDTLPGPDRGDARGRRAAERQRRVVRRHAGRVLRRLLQLGLRAAGRRARRASGSSTIAERFGFNTPAGDPRRGDVSSIPPAERDRRRPRGRLDRDRPGPRAGHARCRWRSSPRRSALRGRRADADARRRRGIGQAADDHAASPSAEVARTRRADDARRRRATAPARAGGDPRRRGRRQDRHGRAAVRPRRCEPEPDNPESLPARPAGRHDRHDAWFAAYAPAGDGTPRVAVGVLLVGAGAGGDTAAPAARAGPARRAEELPRSDLDVEVDERLAATGALDRGTRAGGSRGSRRGS